MPARPYFKDLLILTLGIAHVALGCRSPVQEPLEANLSGAVPSKEEGRNIAPITIFCSRRPAPKDRLDRVDLSLYLELDGHYTAYVLQPGNTKIQASPAVYEAIRGVQCVPQWYQDYKYGQFVLQCQDPGLRPRLHLLYFPTNALGMGDKTHVKKSPWRSDKGDEPLDCATHVKVIPSSPNPEDTLTIIGSAYDLRAKVHHQVVHQIPVDLLSKTKAGEDLILSLSNQIAKDLMPIGAPVFNVQGQLAGYVKEYRPEEFLSLIISNIHDEKTWATLAKTVRLWQPRSLPPSDPLPSTRFINALCQSSLAQSKSDLDPAINSLGIVIQTHCFKNRIEVY